MQQGHKEIQAQPVQLVEPDKPDQMETLETPVKQEIPAKPDEQAIRKIMAEGAAKKNYDCTMGGLLSRLESSALSVPQKDAIKKYATKMTNIGQCLGWCKE